MKKLFSKNAAAMATILLSLCALMTPTARAAADEGYHTYELSGFTVKVPAEFVKSEGWSSETNLSLNSEAVNLREDGEEYGSSATVNVYDFEGSITDLNEYANNMLWSVKAMDEECEAPIVEGNTVLLRSTSELDEGFMINWRFLVVNEDGRIAGGTISYFSEDAKFYDGIVAPIIQSIQFK